MKKTTIKIKKLANLTLKELSMRMIALDTMPPADFREDVEGEKARFVQRQWIKMSVRFRNIISCDGVRLPLF